MPLSAIEVFLWEVAVGSLDPEVRSWMGHSCSNPGLQTSHDGAGDLTKRVYGQV
jgi:hypothetical protein